jgi:crossover junction endodeoxyribonuclease RusA
MVEVIQIEIPLPDPKLWSNRNTHWRAKSPLVKGYRALACCEMQAVMEKSGLQAVAWEKACLSMEFFFKDKRRRDVFNAEAAMKAAIDGCVDAGLISDDDWTHLSSGGSTGGLDRVNPRVIMTFARVKQW